MRVRLLIFLWLALGLSACAQDKVRTYKVSVVAEYPHDENSYTQGLFFHEGRLYESTGQYGQSTFRAGIDIPTGKAQRKFDFARKYFVEGSVILGDKLYILTWTNKVAFVYDAASLDYLQTVNYPYEGWGLTTDGKQLIASDGSATLYFLDGQLRTQRKVTVKMQGRPVRLLNELEYIDGKVWANVYTTDLILIIDPESGRVEATVDCAGLLPSRLRTPQTDVLNGIAYDPSGGKTFLTGKNWKRMYEIKLEKK